MQYGDRFQSHQGTGTFRPDGFIGPGDKTVCDGTNNLVLAVLKLFFQSKI